MNVKLVATAMTMFLAACSSVPRGIYEGGEENETEEDGSDAELRAGETDDALLLAEAAKLSDGDVSKLLSKTCAGEGSSKVYCKKETAAIINIVKRRGGAGKGESCTSLRDNGMKNPWLENPSESINGDYGLMKKSVWNLMYDIRRGLGANDSEAQCWADLAIVAAMNEFGYEFQKSGYGNYGTNKCLESQGDAVATFPWDSLKDRYNQGSGTQNVSVFNMNVEFISNSCSALYGASNVWCKNFDKSSEAGSWSNICSKWYLNRVDQLPNAVARLSDGFDHFGIVPALKAHRGGAKCSSYPDPKWQADCDEFVAATFSTVKKLSNESSARTDSTRLSHQVDYLADDGIHCNSPRKRGCGVTPDDQRTCSAGSTRWVDTGGNCGPRSVQ